MNRKERFGFWLTRREKSLLAYLAASEESISQAAFLRRLLYQAAKSRGLMDIDHLPKQIAVAENLSRETECALPNALEKEVQNVYQ